MLVASGDQEESSEISSHKKNNKWKENYGKIKFPGIEDEEEGSSFSDLWLSLKLNRK